ncbi:hypothetical protein E3N88_07454 [Mikania micrantha]|uniref:No apical meristem-associated C-terminal domain-containing protein n=1 Tax=Mikania micrantha TaxID=192012 RepID=A0A5N6PRP1_9ASTR|nr:hypothetical protein E3N88_07454 [Mikania micrantha]
MLMARGMISIYENPIIGNNQTLDAYWGKLEAYYKEGCPQVSRNAHNLRSHWHMIKSNRRLQFVNDPSNKSSAPFAYEHVWEVVKDHGKYNSSTKVHDFQPPKRSKTNNIGGYTSSALDTNFGDTTEFGISLKDENNDIQVE